MADVLVDSNILLDVATDDPVWGGASGVLLERQAQDHVLVINAVVYAEFSVGFERIEEIERVLEDAKIEVRAIPREAAFLAGKCFVRYRRAGGTRHSPLPDFFIGAHAAVGRMALLTRDVRRYQTYFPRLTMITPGR